jgi:hypothetical protein
MSVSVPVSTRDGRTKPRLLLPKCLAACYAEAAVRGRFAEPRGLLFSAFAESL